MSGIEGSTAVEPVTKAFPLRVASRFFDFVHYVHFAQNDIGMKKSVILSERSESKDLRPLSQRTIKRKSLPLEGKVGPKDPDEVRESK
ncbi:MAG: hypothetical protein IKN36_02445 [Clostridia bacterium]|nr:hypothetical protein [Clostridia bacterium]MBR7033465.1 hypothetical protein [Clostridia bacterium]